jgi:hypothetical protein
VAKHKPVSERFMQKVRVAETGCWEWGAYRMKNGYGLFRMPDRNVLAHRKAHELFVGDIPDGMLVLHECDNRGCVRPEHLKLGTQDDNMHDAAVRMRTAAGVRHGRSKLSELEAIYAKFLPLSQTATAELLGVSQGHVSAIRAGKLWRHLHEGNYHR